MIFYIHGYLSSGDCYKARHYKHYFGSDTVHAPTLPSSLSLAVAQLSDLIAAKRVKEPIGLIGASLGGYLALYLANYFSIPVVLINPVVPPWEGELAVSESGFCRESSHLDHLAPYRVIHFSPFFRQIFWSCSRCWMRFWIVGCAVITSKMWSVCLILAMVIVLVISVSMMRL